MTKTIITDYGTYTYHTFMVPANTTLGGFAAERMKALGMSPRLYLEHLLNADMVRTKRAKQTKK